MDTLNPEPQRNKFFRSNPILNVFFLVCFTAIFSYYLFSAPVFNQSLANRQPTTIHISKGDSVDSITSSLENKHVVRYGSALKIFIKIFKFGRPISVGDYKFRQDAPVWTIAWQIARGIHNTKPIKITFPEGYTNLEMANLLSDKILVFRRDLFMASVEGKQGYLFPDTYFFYQMSTTDEIITAITNDYESRLSSLRPLITRSGHTEKEIINMAAVIQKEAKGDIDAATIAGILWKRIANGMLLQVDADKNTYHTLGLPARPISNPGLIAIKAAITPIDSEYLYYLHDKNGIVHFAKTYSLHKENIARYLR